MFLCLAIDSREPLWSHPILKKHSITLLVIYFINSSHLASLHSNIGLFNSLRIPCSLQVTFLILQSAKYIQGEIWGNHRDYIFYFLPRRESRSCAAYCKILKNICFIHFLIFSLFWAEKVLVPVIHHDCMKKMIYSLLKELMALSEWFT